MIDQWAECGST